MHWKGFIIIIIVLLVVYGVYYLVTEADFVKLLSIPRIFDPLATSAPATRTTTRTSIAPRTPTPPPDTSPARTPTPPEGFTTSDLSPYFDDVHIASVRRPNRYGIGGEFTMRADAAVGQGVDVTGWTIESYRGSIVIFGAGGAVGPVNRARIVIRPNTQGIFYASWSPFVKNVELNACTGYLNERYTLSPKLPNNCPRPPRSELINFPGDCQNFITSLSSCETASPTELNQFSVSRDVACRAFIDTLTYEGCVKRYGDLANFYSYGWRVWMGTELRFDPYHDRLLLFDATGKLVDEYVY